MSDNNILMERKEFLARLKVSDSTERRARQRDPDWPPHVLIGKKVYYRVGAVNYWLRRREAQSCQGSQELAAGELP